MAALDRRAERRRISGPLMLIPRRPRDLRIHQSEFNEFNPERIKREENF
jgi:hypothetical protein